MATNSFQTRSTLPQSKHSFHSIKTLEKQFPKELQKLPFSLKILLENLLRHEDGVAVRKEDILALLQWNPKAEPDKEIQFMPARILLQDFTGVPAVCDLAAMRGAVKRMGGDPSKINPLQPADLVVDHSVQVDYFGSKDAFVKNTAVEYERNMERYEFLKWGQTAFKNFRVVPPETGIVHQVNLEYLAHVAMTRSINGESWVFPDTLIGTDSHTTMINGLGVLGWGVGGIEAEAAMLGQPCSMLIPHVVGFKLKGSLKAGTTATDLVLTATQLLRKKGVVNKFVEFYGPGLANLTLADRATLANMAPEYGATVGLFPVDERTTEYLRLTGRADKATLVEEYYKAQGFWYSPSNPEHEYSDTLELDLSSVEPSLAGPSRPQDRVSLSKVKGEFQKQLPGLMTKDKPAISTPVPVEGMNASIENGSVVIAAITSCTNTSNPAGLIAAGLLAKNAKALGMKAKPWVKTSLAPGSKVVTDYLQAAKLMDPLESLGFHLVGYGCTTCIGNSGPLPLEVAKATQDGQLVVSAVLSGNRNFEGRIHALIRANYLASPALVVAYALAGNVQVDLTQEPLGMSASGKPVFLKDIWPTPDAIEAVVREHVNVGLFQKSYADVFRGDEIWQKMKFPAGDLYKWDAESTYIKEPPYFDKMDLKPAPLADIKGARVLALLGDSITTDHISPAGNISKNSAAGQYLVKLGVTPDDFNSYGARRGNHEVMIRGTFANVRLKNLLLNNVEGGFTLFMGKQNGKDGAKQLSIYDASAEYKANGIQLVVLAGKEYGTGSSRDWAAKGTRLLGIQAVIAESFERIHRSNLVGMGVLPLQFKNGESAKSHGLDGTELISISGLAQLKPLQDVTVTATPCAGGPAKTFAVRCRIDTPNEIEYYKHGGILPYVLRQIVC